jgi:F420-dependent oxidoreductase-like protein
MIKFGIQTPQEGFTFEKLKNIWLECEKLGFASAWLYDHMQPICIQVSSFKEPLLESWTTLSALATITSRLRIGVLVTCNSFRSPSLLAKIASTVDNISGGRLEFGIGCGWFKEEHLAYGLPFSNFTVRIQQLRESLQIIKKMWSEEISTFDGKYYSLKNAINYPKPLQKPHPPIWIGGKNMELLKLTAEFADAWNALYLSPKEFEEKAKIIKQQCTTIGKDVNKIILSLTTDVIISKDKNEITKKINKLKLNNPKKKVREMPLEEYQEKRIIGTPDQCIEKIYEYINAGVNYFILYFPDASEIKPLRFFSESVMSHFIIK